MQKSGISGLLMKTKQGMPEEQVKAEAERLKALWWRFKRNKEAAGQDVTQADVADQLGWTQGNFSHLINGRQPIPLETLFDLAVIMEFDAREVRPGVQRLIDNVFKSTAKSEPSLLMSYAAELSTEDLTTVLTVVRSLAERAAQR